MSEGRDPVHVQGDPCIGTGGSPYKKLKGGRTLTSEVELGEWFTRNRQGLGGVW